jgi:hypothetical protein
MVKANLRRLQTALVDIKRAQLSSTRGLEERLDHEEPRIQTVGPDAADLESLERRPSDEEWVHSTWPSFRGSLE